MYCLCWLSALASPAVKNPEQISPPNAPNCSGGRHDPLHLRRRPRQFSNPSRHNVQGPCNSIVNDHFLDLTDGVRIESPLIWECTRFCISPRADAEIVSNIASSLLISSCEMGLNFGATDSVGVFDARMVRIYRRLGWEPTVLGTKGEGRDKTSVGLWELSEDALVRMCERSGITRETSKKWFNGGFSYDAQVNAA